MYIHWVRKVTVDVLVIEARGDDEAKDRAARALLERVGMVFYAKQATNHWCAADACHFGAATLHLQFLSSAGRHCSADHFLLLVCLSVTFIPCRVPRINAGILQ